MTGEKATSENGKTHNTLEYNTLWRLENFAVFPNRNSFLRKYANLGELSRADFNIKMFLFVNAAPLPDRLPLRPLASIAVPRPAPRKRAERMKRNKCKSITQ